MKEPQELQRLKDEVAFLRRMLWFVVHSNGGGVIVEGELVQAHKHENVEELLYFRSGGADNLYGMTVCALTVEEAKNEGQ